MALVWPAEAQYVPAVQLIQLDIPVTAAKVPDAQFMHALEPTDGVNVPFAQSLQTFADDAAYRPVAQVPVMADPPMQ